MFIYYIYNRIKLINNKIGLIGIIDKKSHIINEDPQFLEDARSRIGILAVSLSSLWEGNEIFRRKLIALGKTKELLIEILLLEPSSKYLQYRADADEISHITLNNKINNAIREFKKFKQGGINIKLYIYNECPIWHIILVDNVYARISYYPSNKPDNEAPYYKFNDEGKYNLLTPFIKYFEELKDRSTEIDLTKSYDQL